MNHIGMTVGPHIISTSITAGYSTFSSAVFPWILAGVLFDLAGPPSQERGVGLKLKLSIASPASDRRKPGYATSLLLQFFGVMIGAVLAAVGLELFLMPHGIVVGGITGLSALFAIQSEMKLGLFLFLMNLPFLLLQRKNIDASFAIFTIFGLFAFSLGTIMLHPYPALMSDALAAALVGGLCLGLGFGLALRFGGALDTASKQVAEKLHGGNKWFPVDGTIQLFNCLILLAAGFYFGIKEAVYSVTAYILAYESVKVPLFGLKLNVLVHIESRACADIQKTLERHLNRRASYVGEAINEGSRQVLKYKINRWETPRFKAIVKNCDPDSDISMRP